jgi:hypothetical protein
MEGSRMSTYRCVERATGLNADRVLSAAVTQRPSFKSSPINDEHMWLSLTKEPSMQ